MKDLFKDFNISKFKKKKPPGNKSLGTFKEIKELKKIKGDRKFVEDKDNVFTAFKSVAEKNNIEYPTKLVKTLINESDKPIMDLKNFYKRSRPKVVAEELGVELDDIELKKLDDNQINMIIIEYDWYINDCTKWRNKMLKNHNFKSLFSLPLHWTPCKGKGAFNNEKKIIGHEVLIKK